MARTGAVRERQRSSLLTGVPGVISEYHRQDRRRSRGNSGVVAVASGWLRSAPDLRRASRTAPPGFGPAGYPAGPRLARVATRPTGPAAARPRSSARPAPSPSPNVGGCFRSNGPTLAVVATWQQYVYSALKATLCCLADSPPLGCRHNRQLLVTALPS